MFVSGAAGAVGSLAGQIAKLRGPHGHRQRRLAGEGRPPASTSSASTPRSTTTTARSREQLAGRRAGRHRRLLRQRRRRAPRGRDRRAATVRPRRAVRRDLGLQRDRAAARPAQHGAAAIGKRLTLRGFIVTDHSDRCRRVRRARSARWVARRRVISSARRSSTAASRPRRRRSSTCCAAPTSARWSCAWGEEAPGHPASRPGPVPARAASGRASGARASRSTCRRSPRSAALQLDAPVTLLAGDNGTGKSTLVEALRAGDRVRAPTAASSSGRASCHAVPRRCSAARSSRCCTAGHKPRNGYFLRAESFFNVAAFVDGGGEFSPDLSLYGGVPLHEQSHGESFLALAANRFAGEGLYILDEPEAALSVTRRARAARRSIARAAQRRRAVHHRHPLADPARLPRRRIYELDDDGFARVRLRRPRRRPPHPRLPRATRSATCAPRSTT